MYLFGTPGVTLPRPCGRNSGALGAPMPAARGPVSERRERLKTRNRRVIAVSYGSKRMASLCTDMFGLGDTCSPEVSLIGGKHDGDKCLPSRNRGRWRQAGGRNRDRHRTAAENRDDRPRKGSACASFFAFRRVGSSSRPLASMTLHRLTGCPACGVKPWADPAARPRGVETPPYAKPKAQKERFKAKNPAEITLRGFSYN